MSAGHVAVAPGKKEMTQSHWCYSKAASKQSPMSLHK
ncbi:hypothetical protein YPC_0061 [Yersinia pestis biovar Medievalis str. Harbin 35]|nr:hypothetical protein YPC_0061 [Yersinia pestis biovar Medievalis str. Harbin 35]EEO74860.1 hypothetical protein YP516_4470 [Yersinia pestis Nepal516]EEO86394.1 hypothetical protein YPH_2310 [Yersinia pestis biovar Orientalis str. PEXU2]